MRLVLNRSLGILMIPFISFIVFGISDGQISYYRPFQSFSNLIQRLTSGRGESYKHFNSNEAAFTAAQPFQYKTIFPKGQSQYFTTFSKASETRPVVTNSHSSKFNQAQPGKLTSSYGSPPKPPRYGGNPIGNQNIKSFQGKRLSPNKSVTQQQQARPFYGARPGPAPLDFAPFHLFGPLDSFSPPSGQQDSYGPLPNPPLFPYGPDFYHDHHDHHDGWGWGWGWTTTTPDPRCLPFSGPIPNVTSPDDLPEGWKIVDTDLIVVPTESVLLPPLGLVPVSPSFIRIGYNREMPPGFQTSFMQRLTIDLSENSRNKGYSLTKEVQYLNDSINANAPIPTTGLIKENAIVVTTMVHKSANVSAPLKGAASHFFKVGLDDLEKNKKSGASPPLFNKIFESQLFTLGQLFNDLESIERSYKHRYRNEKDWDQDTMDTPMFVCQVQQLTIPEPDSSERTILDSVYNFGQLAYHTDYGDLSGLVEEWEETKIRQQEEKDEGRLKLSRFSGMEEAIDSMDKWVKDWVNFFRDLSRNGFYQSEEMASETFKTFQFLLRPPGGACNEDFDPTRQGTNGAESQGFGGVLMRGPPPMFDDKLIIG